MKSYTPKTKFVEKDREEQITSILNTKSNYSVKDSLRWATHLFRRLNTPTSLGLAICIRYNDLESLLTHEVKPCDYVDSESYFADAQACKFLSKLNIPINGVDPAAKALEIFYECEGKCEAENEFWRRIDVGLADLTPRLENILTRAKHLIAEILGEFDVCELLDQSRFGKGAVAFTPRSQCDFVKLNEAPTVCGKLTPLAGALLAEYPGWMDGLTYSGNAPLKVVRVTGGKHSTVPKKALIDRNTESQPALNLFLQRGFGRLMAERLRKVGIDLTDQTVNQELARKGSIDNKLCTLDLRNASDTISRGLVRFLLPSRWYHALDMIRTQQILVEGEWRPLHRFSSMGNGYTFELQSLLFYAILRAVVKGGRVSVFGDDIIVPSHGYKAAVWALERCGFEPNLQKSYSSGPFRESCGGDFFLGALVRPYYLKELPCNEAEIICMVNGFARRVLRGNVDLRSRAGISGFIHYLWRLINPTLFGRLATGWPTDDSFLIGWRYKSGLRVIAEATPRRVSSWYAAKTVMLYRQFRANQGITVEEQDENDKTSRILRRDSGTVYSSTSYDPLYWRINFGRSKSEPDELYLNTVGS